MNCATTKKAGAVHGFSPSRRAAFGLLGAALLAGCGGPGGFRPLYGSGAGAGGSLMNQVRLAPAARGDLPDRLNRALARSFGAPFPEAPLLLETTPAAVRRGLAVGQDDAVTRYNLDLVVSYRLKRGEALLASGEVETIAAVNAVASQYATLVSERESLGRAAEDAADKIFKRLAVEAQPEWWGP
ncbi:LPS assembly lipoprotein LptE [Neomegalonema perideroedes]|uniref:LPS assembly lipoprotein LptE n=1 Tax=Neomegalonema perideroedes TaxID=217219 RepID=UPI000365CDB6|nr:LPS assembly lipoprotein LptE [Neomegalonema perideroedes]